MTDVLLFFSSFTFSAPPSTPNDNKGKPEEPVNIAAHEAGSPVIDGSHEQSMSQSLIFFFDWNLHYFDFRLCYFCFEC